MRFCIRLLERYLHADFCDPVVGDLLEQRRRGMPWMLRQTVSALVLLRLRPRPGDSMFATFLNDLRIAARYLRHAPAFAITSVLTLALSIGATTAIFSAIEPVLLRPLPYPESDRLAFVWERGRDGARENVGFATARDIGRQSRSIERWAAVGSWEPTVGETKPERLTGDRVSWTYFRTLGVTPALGRDFLAEEDQPGHNQEVILSHGLWQRLFGGDSSIIGRSISVGGAPMAVVGVMPASFDNVISPSAEIWRVLGYAVSQPFACRTCHHLRMIARLNAGIDVRSAATELDAIHAGLARQYPEQYASVGALVVRLQDQVTRAFRPALLALAGAVVLVLLIAVANVVNLQLARAVRRQDEFAIRTALGAARRRLTQQLLAEGILLAALGGAGGALIARLGLPLLIARLPRELPRVQAIHLDATALGVVAGLVLGVALVMTLAPSLGRDSDLATSLRSGRRLSTGAQHATRSALVVTEVALAVMLLASAGLVAKSLMRLLAVDPGFDESHLLTLEVDAVGPRYADAAAVNGYHDRIREAVQAVPGVVNVALANQIPIGGNMDMYGVLDHDNPPANPEMAPSGDRYVVSPSYLRTMHIPVLRGRMFTEREALDTAGRVVLVSVALGNRLWPGQNPVGHHVQMGGPDAPVRTVIGVTGNVKHGGLDAVTELQWYAPPRQWLFPDNNEMVVVRTLVDAAAIAPAVRRAIASVDASAPIIRVATMDQVIARSTAQRRLALVLFAAFAVVSLLLAAAGIYGVLAGRVAERTRELGVRSALGAPPAAIIRLVMSQGVGLSGAGLALGLAGCAALTRYLQALLFGIQASDPGTLAAVVVVLGVVTLAACLVPATRAVRIDPSEALRSE